ncbi:MFS transporter [Mesotoga sp.]|uniref:MFS transporter n=1 Tax=Mesotoga sp. TaxID=2053577 RepID=UPI00345EBC96
MNNMVERMKSNIKKNYLFSFLMNMRLSSGLWMIYMASKGMSLTQIGFLEGIFHVTSLTMEVPTGSVADLFGRKLSRTIGRCLSLVSILVLIGSRNFLHFALFMILAALSYNLESGSGEALVYDSLKYLKKEDNFISVLGRQEAIFQVSSVAALLVGGFLGTYNDSKVAPKMVTPVKDLGHILADSGI